MELIICLSIMILLFIVILFCTRNQNNIFKQYYYFDANGTTPIHKKALQAYVNASYLGNASASYATKSNQIINQTHNIIKNWLSLTNHRIVFNSGASEGNNYIMRATAASFQNSARPPHFIISSIEHKTSLDCAKCLARDGKIELSIIPPGKDGIINPILVDKAIQPNTVLISIMHVNNEIGSINNIQVIGQIAKTRGVFFHTDMVQSFGKFSTNIPGANVDAATVSFHKIHGPLGVGAIIMSNEFATYLKGSAQIKGSQFNGYRGGTVNTPGIAAAGECMKITFKDRIKKNMKLQNMKNLLIRSLSTSYPLVAFDKIGIMNLNKIKNPVVMVILGPTIDLLPDHNNVSPNTLLLSFIGTSAKICNIKLKQYLMDAGYIISIGSACNTSSDKASHVLQAIKTPDKIKSGIIRISFNDENTPRETKKLANIIKKAINHQI